LGRESNSTLKECGDGVIIVLLLKEGSQESFFNKTTTSEKSRGNPLLTTKVEVYYPLHIITRKISSKPLQEIEVYKKAQPGDITADSEINLKKLRDRVMNWTFDFQPAKMGMNRAAMRPNPNDKLIETILKELIEPELAKIAPKKSLHQALLEIKRMIGITWIIQGDRRGDLNKIDHHILAKLIQEKNKTGPNHNESNLEIL
jgi:hypothetical protein